MSGMKAQFDLPGFTASILAPSDAAFTTFLKGTESFTAFYVPYIVVLCNDVTVFSDVAVNHSAGCPLCVREASYLKDAHTMQYDSG